MMILTPGFPRCMRDRDSKDDLQENISSLYFHDNSASFLSIKSIRLEKSLSFLMAWFWNNVKRYHLIDAANSSLLTSECVAKS